MGARIVRASSHFGGHHHRRTVKQGARFERQGLDLIARKQVNFAEAALGATLPLELIDGTVRDVDLRAGTQPGDIITLAGLGAPDVNGPGRGSLHVVVQVEVPKKLSKRAKQLLKELQEDLAKGESD